MRIALALFALALLPLYACSEEAQGLGDTGAEPADLGTTSNDAETQDGAPVDLGSSDSGAIDGGVIDGGGLDATDDAGASDAADQDAADPDASDQDAAEPDATVPDAGDGDAGAGDVGGGDAGPPVQTSCVGQADNTVCSNDPLQAERCLNEVCVGTYVAPSGSPANPGTRLLPKATIGDGLLVARTLPGIRNVVYVAKDVGTVRADYAENLQLDANDHLSGGWQRGASGNYSLDIANNETRITPSDVQGMILQGGTAANLSVSGFWIYGSASGNVTTALIISAGSATLQDLIVTGSPGGSESRAIAIGGTGANSVLRRVNAGGGESADLSIGLDCGSCPGLSVESSTLAGSIADVALGLSISGDTSGIIVRNSRLIGGVIGNGGAPPILRAGLRLSGCTANGAQIRRSELRGQLAGGTSGSAVGALVEANCTLEMSGSLAIGLSYPGGPAAAFTSNAYGVACIDPSSRCLLRDNVELRGVEERAGGQGSAEATAIAIAALVDGSGEITSSGPRLQRLSSGPGASTVGLAHRLSSPAPSIGGALIVRRVDIRAGACTAVGSSNIGIGAMVTGPTQIENSVILGGSCGTTGGILNLAMTAGIGATTQTFFHNHIESGSGAVAQFGAMITNPVGSGITGRSGALVNNTIVAGTGVAVAEGEVPADWELLYGNNLSGAILFLDEGSASIVDIALVNALALAPVAQGNISAPPQVDASFHLLTGSPNLGAGVGVAPGHTLPALDMDGQARPNPANTNPDIGPDEGG